MDENTTEPVVLEIIVGAPVEAVWQSLRDRELIRQWHGWHYPGPDGSADGLDAEIDVIFFQQVVADDENHILQLGDGDRFELTADQGQTVVRVIRAPYVPDTEWSAYYTEVTEGWITFLQQLRFLHHGHPGGVRRTLFFTGEGQRDVLERLAEEPPLGGGVWFQSERQRGLLLEDLGPGLLITAALPGGAEQESGIRAMAVVTTFGQDDEAFAATRDRFTAWWRSGYPDAAEPSF